MSDILHDTVSDLVFNKWGTQKTFKVIGMTIIGGAIASIMGATLIQDKPKVNLEKENELS